MNGIPPILEELWNAKNHLIPMLYCWLATLKTTGSVKIAKEQVGVLKKDISIFQKDRGRIVESENMSLSLILLLVLLVVKDVRFKINRSNASNVLIQRVS